MTVIKFPQQHTQIKKICSKRCAGGNPYRGYLCQCGACGGKAHGALNIKRHTLLEVADRKLMDFTISKTEWAWWMRLHQFLIDSQSAYRPTPKKRRG